MHQNDLAPNRTRHDNSAAPLPTLVARLPEIAIKPNAIGIKNSQPSFANQVLTIVGVSRGFCRVFADAILSQRLILVPSRFRCRSPFVWFV
jgi:hypothetical protein